MDEKRYNFLKLNDSANLDKMLQKHRRCDIMLQGKRTREVCGTRLTLHFKF